MNGFKMKIFILLFLFVITSFRPVLADQSEYQKSLAAYEQSKTIFASSQVADEKADNAKDLLAKAIQLAIDYQKLVKEKTALISELSDDQKNSFNTRLASQIATQESDLGQINTLSDSNQIKNLFKKIKQRWQKDFYLISEINGTILGSRSKDIIQKIKDTSQLLEQKIQDYPNKDSQKEATTFLDESKQNLTDAEKQCQESLSSFLLVKNDPANAETLTSDGQHKFQNCQISLKRSIKSLKTASQAISLTGTSLNTEDISSEASNNTISNTRTSLDY